MVSIPACSMAPASMMASMPTRARAPLLMSTASTRPEDLKRLTDSRMRSRLTPLGGSISTETTNFPSSSLR